MESTLCNKQYVRIAETAFITRLSNHRKDTKHPNAMLACTHFTQQSLNFHSHAKFIVITSSSKNILRERLIQQENFLIQKLNTKNSTD